MFLIFFVYFLCRYRRYAQFLCFFLQLATIHTRLFAKLTEGSEIWWRHRQGLRHHGSWWVSWVTCLTCTGWYCYNTDTDIFKNRRKSHPQRLKLVIHNFQNVSPTDTHNCCSCRFAPPPPPVASWTCAGKKGIVATNFAQSLFWPLTCHPLTCIIYRQQIFTRSHPPLSVILVTHNS